MAELTKKYLDELAVEALVTNIKAEDAKGLAAAKKYTDEAVKLCDASGAAATAEANAKAYTDKLANGAVKENTEAIAKLNGDATTEGSVAKAIADAKATIDADIDTVDAKADKNAEDIAAINDAENGILAQAKAFATAEDAKVQANIDTLAGKVGEVPADQTVMGIISNIQENAYDDTELRGLIEGLEDTKADKEQVAKDIAAAVKVETDARVEAIAGVQGEIDALEKTHGEDKTALEGAIALKADQTALDAVSAVANAAAKATDLEAEVTRAQGEEARIEGLVTAEAAKAREEESKLDARLVEVETFFKTAEGETLDQALDTLVELQKYVTDEGAVADKMLLDIAANAKAIEEHVATDHDFATADEAIKNELNAEIAKKADATVVEGIDGRVEVLEGEMDTVEGKVSTLEGKMTTVEGAVATKAEAQALTDAVAALEGADADQVERIEALEAKFGDGEGSVEDQIANAKQEAIDAAAGDATTKANQALADAKAYADEEDAKIESRVDALEAASATHALASDLTALAGRVTTAEGKVTTLEGEMDAVEAAVATKAEQADLTALTTRVTTAEGKVTTLEGKMTAVETKANDNADAIAALTTTHNEDKATLQAAIDANTSAIKSFVAISADEINAMFA